MTDQCLWFEVQMNSYTLLKPDCHSWWISKMQSGREDTLEERYVIKFCFKLGKNAMRWKLDLLLWSRDQETEFPVEACWLSLTQEGQTEQIYPQAFDDPFFWQHDLYALGSHWTVWRQIKIKRSLDEQPFKSLWELVHLNIVITKRGVYFSHVWRRGGLALDPS